VIQKYSSGEYFPSTKTSIIAAFILRPFFNACRPFFNACRPFSMLVGLLSMLVGLFQCLSAFFQCLSAFFQVSETSDLTLKGHNGPVIDFDLSQTDEVWTIT
jgi:hypothetical protein